MSKNTRHAMHAPAPGARLLIRDQEWVVRSMKRTHGNDYLVGVIGLTPLVRDAQWQFIWNRETIVEVQPNETKLVCDPSPNYLAARLHIESLLRTTPPPDNKLYLGHLGAIDSLEYQREPALLALKQPRPRILIADGTGLGKTIEAGILVSELIRRGRGKRILVVSLASMLTQFQKELWSRFSIPLVRLDSIGINRVREQLPAGHNPFHHFDRAIISIDTLKNATTWRPFLENANWDIVVIDEVQNVAKRKNQRVSLRHQLADILASRCDSLIMLSATPHDGQAESFASLIKMLDPTVIADEKNYTKKDLDGKHLLIRRFKKDIRDQAEMKNRETALKRAPASDEEEEVFGIIADTNHEQLSQRMGDGWLLRTTMEKAVLSSPAACLKSVQNRIKKLQKTGGDTSIWHQLENKLQQIGHSQFSKYQLLLRLIKELGWTGRSSQDRLLIFTERIATLEFLKTHLLRDLKLREQAIQTLHGTLSDSNQQEIVDKFGQEQSPVRLLISTDVGSEGINLHYYCHKLIHFDIPWSLMRFQQRNGRIDRYGQKEIPHIFYLITESQNEKFRGDTKVLRILIDKEKQAEKNLGDPAVLMGVYQIHEEEKQVAKVIENPSSKQDAEEQLTSSQSDPLKALLGSTHSSRSGKDSTRKMPSLFASDYFYAKAALAHIQRNWARQAGANLNVIDNDEKQRIIVVPENKQGEMVLKSVVGQLPVGVRPTGNRFELSASPQAMMESILKSRADENAWPKLQYLWHVHPFMEWMTDKIRLSFRRLEAPAIWLSTMPPNRVSYLITVLWPNQKGITIFQRWYLVTGYAEGNFDIRLFEKSNIYEKLQSSQLPNRGRESDLLGVAQKRIPQVVEQATEYARKDREGFKTTLEDTLKQHEDELKKLEENQKNYIEFRYQSNQGVEHMQRGRREKELGLVHSRFEEFRDWIKNSMTMEKDPYVHIVAVFLAEH